MLGNSINDPLQVEGQLGCVDGFQFLNMQTLITHQKQLKNVSGKLAFDNVDIEGYEIHAGISRGEALDNPFCELADGNDGAMSEDQHIIGTYVHGLFQNKATLDSLLRWAGLKEPQTLDYNRLCEQQLDRLADVIDEHLDTDMVYQLLTIETK
jgi:adenosylcobyric acid synthase